MNLWPFRKAAPSRKMLVSVVLHFDAPNMDGNQREFEASYMGYNRQYAELIERADGWTCEIHVQFPKSGEDYTKLCHDKFGVPRRVKYFSIGVCEPLGRPGGVGLDKGGSIINFGSIDTPDPAGLEIETGTFVRLKSMVGVFHPRIAAMLKDGRMGPLDQHP